MLVGWAGFQQAATQSLGRARAEFFLSLSYPAAVCVRNEIRTDHGVHTDHSARSCWPHFTFIN